MKSAGDWEKRLVMIEEIKYEIALKKLDVVSLLDSLGIPTDVLKNEVWIPCPNPEHYDRNPSCTINIDSTSEKFLWFSCFGCGISGKLPKVLKLLKGITYTEAKKLIIDFTKDNSVGATQHLHYSSKKQSKKRVKIKLPAEYRPVKVGSGNAYESYLLGRGVLPEYIEHYDWGFCATGTFKKRVILPMLMNGKLVNFWARHIRKNDVKDKIRNARFSRAEHIVFPYDEIDFDLNFIWVTESPLNYFALKRIGLKKNVIALLGGRTIISDFKLKLLSRFKKIRCVQDGDAAGLAMVHKIWNNMKNKSSVESVNMPDEEDAASLKDEELEQVLDTLHPAQQMLELARQLAVDYQVKKKNTKNKLQS